LFTTKLQTLAGGASAGTPKIRLIMMSGLNIVGIQDAFLSCSGVMVMRGRSQFHDMFEHEPQQKSRNGAHRQINIDGFDLLSGCLTLEELLCAENRRFEDGLITARTQRLVDHDFGDDDAEQIEVVGSKRHQRMAKIGVQERAQIELAELGRIKIGLNRCAHTIENAEQQRGFIWKAP